MSLDKDALKSQLRIDGTQDDDFITELISEAQDFIIHGVDSTQSLDAYEQHPIFDRAVALLVGHWYFNRQESYTQSRLLSLDIPFGVEDIVNSLRGIMLNQTTTTTTTGSGS